MKKEKIVLSISPIGHDTSAAILVGNDIIAACEQERYSKDKHSRLFPIDAINDCLKIAGTNINQVDLIVVPWQPKLMIREFYLRTAIESDKRLDFLRNDLNRIQELFELEETIRDKLSYSGRLEFVNHHLCHLSSSYYSSGFNNALVVSYDGSGETDTMAIATAENGHITIKENPNKYPNSLGLMYAAVTYFLGWQYACDEGIIMGLASYGDPTAIIPGKDLTYLEVFEKAIIEEDDFKFNLTMPDFFDFYEARDVWIGKKFIEYFGPKRDWDAELTNHHMNIAAGLQRRLEDVVIAQLKSAKNKYKMNNLCISGGVGLNCTLNGKIVQQGIFDEVFVVPPSGDAGTTIGGCYLGLKILKSDIEIRARHNFYLGSRFTNEEIEKSLKALNVEYSKSKNIYKDTASLLADGLIIGWFQGGAEFGPRALGNRSIITRPYPSEMKDTINSRVKFREEFRPFAPAVMVEKFKQYFNLKQESPHMLIAVQANKDRSNAISSTVHIDGSARVQTVSKEINEKFWNLINEFNSITEVPVLLNTSFNVKGQPIVNNPEDAINTFLSTNIDVLVIGDFILQK